MNGQLDLLTGALADVAAPITTSPRLEVAGIKYQRSAALGDCADCWDDQHSAHRAGTAIPFRRRALYVRKAKGEPDVAVCETHKHTRQMSDGA